MCDDYFNCGSEIKCSAKKNISVHFESVSQFRLECLILYGKIAMVK